MLLTIDDTRIVIPQTFNGPQPFFGSQETSSLWTVVKFPNDVGRRQNGHKANDEEEDLVDMKVAAIRKGYGPGQQTAKDIGYIG